MAEEESGKDFHLENVLEKLLDFQSAQGADCLDSMLMLSLVNLLGIVSLLNKQSGSAGVQAPGAVNPMLGTLFKLLSGGGPQAREPASGAGPGALTPAALMSMLNPQPGKTPDPAALMKLMSTLSSLMGNFGKPQPGTPAGAPEKPEQPGQNRVEAAETTGGSPGRVKEVKKTEGPLKWDARLGKATG
ncbi:MAG: hypothetical protein K6U04_13685 [Armatimonadetes bacterium]|nr:hypothetical protein [Armatimonadota bacterium]